MTDVNSIFSADGLNLRPSAIRAFARILVDPAIISFAGGLPNPETFPTDRIAFYADRVIRDRKGISLQYGPTAGLLRLRESIVSIQAGRKFQSTAADVLITTGSQQGLALISHALLDPGDVVLVELPTYIGAASAFHSRRADLVGVAQDDEGIVPDSLESAAREVTRSKRRVKFLYTIPNFQNPSGRLMSQTRREQVLDIARRHDFLIVEDDPYGELVYVPDVDTTPIKSLDQEQRVIYLSSFSKVLAPGLRCGWITGAPNLLAKFELTKEAFDLCSGMLDQSIVDEFCAAGELSGQIDKVREFYRSKRDLFIGELERYFEGKADWTPADGGLFTFLTLRDDRDTAALVPRSIELGVAYIPGAPFFVDGSGANSMRLTFAKENDDRLREGTRRLHQLLFPEESS
ncbi:MAG TPA: PLP-dependent aminotransferase family protein [Thermoanaerobaculia bacterium]|nr:PLP-dependent aminotransferase family protein [Thermoanaerobaculia bacterium]